MKAFEQIATPRTLILRLVTEPFQHLTNYVFTKSNYQTLVAYITQNNLASQKVALKKQFLFKGLTAQPSFEDQVFLYEKQKPVS